MIREIGYTHVTWCRACMKQANMLFRNGIFCSAACSSSGVSYQEIEITLPWHEKRASYKKIVTMK